VGFVVDKAALGQVFSEYFGFPCRFSFHQMLHTHLSSVANTTGQLVADVPSGLSLTQPQKTKKKIDFVYSKYFFFGARAQIWALDYLYETLSFTLVF
jgi:hypothetical protein